LKRKIGVPLLGRKESAVDNSQHEWISHGTKQPQNGHSVRCLVRIEQRHNMHAQEVRLIRPEMPAVIAQLRIAGQPGRLDQFAE
jgi:hypothetical protein